MWRRRSLRKLTVSVCFDDLNATQVSVTDMRPDATDPPFPEDTTEKLPALNEVVAADEPWTGADRVAVAYSSTSKAVMFRE